MVLVPRIRLLQTPVTGQMGPDSRSNAPAISPQT
jgi:hypothetical protein